MCRPMPQGTCEPDDGWLCPGWEQCTERYGTCLSTKCCKDPGFGCFRRPQADHAQCRPLAQGACTDTDDWLCPGWEMCSDPFQACTNTHCCADKRFVCYSKRPHFAQCLRRGSCKKGVDGDCEETRSELGQCSAPYHDCHLTGCCQRGEDHCFLKNDFYGQCRPTCTAQEVGPDWSCARHELPNEAAKVTCETLRTRNNIYKRLCSTQYENAGACNQAFRSEDNVYQPCKWHADSNSCQESGQILACDCALRGQNCPQHKVAAAATGGQAASHSSAPPSSGGMSTGEVVVVAIAIVVIVLGCGGLSWLFFFSTRDGSRLMDTALEAADDEPRTRKKKKEKVPSVDREEELESMEL